MDIVSFPSAVRHCTAFPVCSSAMYHFLFVPLTLGLSVLLAIMESIYVTTGRTIWRDMVRFWGTLRHGRCHWHHHGIRVWHQLSLPV